MDVQQETQQTYYERVTKAKREAERQARLAELGVARLPRGPQRKYDTDLLHLNLYFDGDVAQFIREEARDVGWQAFFDRLVEQEMQRRSS